MIQAVSGGVSADPIPMPLIVIAMPSPRSCGPHQLATARLKFGKAAASPTPIRNRTSMSDPQMPRTPARNDDGVRAVIAVKSDHQTTARVRTFLGPHRSPSRPPGIWNRAYPRTNAEKICPIWTLVSPRAGIICRAVTEMLTLSI